jgi:hypothetical protein
MNVEFLTWFISFLKAQPPNKSNYNLSLMILIGLALIISFIICCLQSQQGQQMGSSKSWPPLLRQQILKVKDVTKI